MYAKCGEDISKCMLCVCLQFASSKLSCIWCSQERGGGVAGYQQTTILFLKPQGRGRGGEYINKQLFYIINPVI